MDFCELESSLEAAYRFCASRRNDAMDPVFSSGGRGSGGASG